MQPDNDNAFRTPDDDVFRPPEELNEDQSHPEDEGDAVKTRRQNLKKESGIKGVGIITLVMGGIMTYSFLSTIYALITFEQISRQVDGSRAQVIKTTFLVFVAIQGLITALTWLTGSLLLKRQHAGRVLFTILGSLLNLFLLLALIGVLNTGQAVVILILMGMMGLLIYFKVVLWTQPAGIVFSRRYKQQIIPKTRHIRCPIPVWTWIIVGIMVIIVALSIVSQFMRRG